MALPQRTPDELREYQRFICHDLRLLRKEREPTWGFTILRTVYTPASDTEFPLFLRKLDTYIKREIDTDLLPKRPRYDRNGRLIKVTPPDPAPNAELYRRYRNDVIEDREKLEGADVEQVRQEFNARGTWCGCWDVIQLCEEPRLYHG